MVNLLSAESELANEKESSAEEKLGTSMPPKISTCPRSSAPGCGEVNVTPGFWKRSVKSKKAFSMAIGNFNMKQEAGQILHLFENEMPKQYSKLSFSGKLGAL